MSISLSSNFDLITALPLDARFAKADNTARDAIASLQRFDGLLVYTLDTNTLWQLQGGITNADWVAIGTGAPGSDGADGLSILNGAGDPTGGDGVDGEFWINTTSWEIFGPKASGAWPAGQSLIGPQGDPGLSVLHGHGAPVDLTDGVDGQFWIDEDSYEIYGPKTAGAWGSPTSLIGPQGDPGDADVAVDWEGVEVLPQIARLNFKGAGVQSVVDAGSGVIDVTIPGGGGSGESGPTPFGECDAPLNVDSTGLSRTNSNMSITAMEQVIFVQSSSAGNKDITANPQIEGHSQIGAEMIVVGKDDTKTVQFDDGNGLKLNGSCLLGLNDTLRLFWDGSFWVELRRSA